jgi:DNA-binding MarR family transcriptional regulator
MVVGVTSVPTSLDHLILEIFRLNGALLASGDDLVAELGLTSARWQVLGAIAREPAPEPVSRLARSIGLQRQGVQRIVNELAAEGFVKFADNPHHRRAQLVLLTPKGRNAYARAMEKREPWVRALAEGLSEDRISGALDALRHLRARLEAQGPR